MCLGGITHTLKKELCVRHLELDGEWIVCAKCKALIGFIFRGRNRANLFIFGPYKCHKRQIERWFYEHSQGGDSVDNISEQEWRSVLRDLKQWREDYIYSVECEEGDGECGEDNEGEEPDGIGEID